MYKITALILSILILSGCQYKSVMLHSPSTNKPIIRKIPSDIPYSKTQIAEIMASYDNRKPSEWGERVTGVLNSFETSKKEIALTFDACGGPHGSSVDDELITYLINEKISSTLFVNGRWIDENTTLFKKLADNPLFEIQNHGTHHLPLSVNGQSAWGITGTTSVEEVVAEMKKNENKIAEYTGTKPTLFRSGTAYYDDIAVEIANELGIQIVNYTILGDAGATFTSDEVKQALIKAKPGDIALLHMNQPDSGTADGLQQAVPILQKKGYSFVQLHNQNLQ
ncbi:polysaccharide deacetylase family protein [Pseudalkalibacillus hwajinpoensis]|nr:polysaccharide deacetylase family protein [Pseudalkalibacillus hwajinpoensis]